ncbi:MAG: DUF1127 domain-containing protein [Allorhizobium sp.]
MHKEQSVIAQSPLAAIEEICRTFGFWSSAKALLYVALRRRRLNSASDLSDRMRADIGLPPEHRWHRPARFDPWDLRF